MGNKKFRQVREPTLHGLNKLEEHYDKGFLTSQKEEIDGNPSLLKIIEDKLKWLNFGFILNILPNEEK